MATLNNAISSLATAGSGRAEVSAGGGVKTAQNTRDFAQLMSGEIKTRADDAARSSPTAGNAAKTSMMPSGDLGGDMPHLLAQLQNNIHALLAQTPPLPSAVQQSLKALQQALTSMTASLEIPVDGANPTLISDKTRSDLQKQLEQIQALLSQPNHGDNWSTQVQAMALTITQGLNPEIKSANPLVEKSKGAVHKGAGFAPEGLNQTDRTTQAQNIPASNTPINASNLTTPTMPAQMTSMAALITLAQKQINPEGMNLLRDNSSAANFTQPQLMPSSLATDGLTALNSGLPLSVPASLPSAGIGSLAGNSVWANIPGALDLNQPKMPADLGQNIQWMVGRNISRATLEINPANLGPLKITIDQQGDQMQIQIIAAHHLTRDVLDQAMPRLREFLQDAGLSHAEVSLGSPDAQTGQNPFMNQNQDAGQSSGFNKEPSHNARGESNPAVLDHSNMGDALVQKIATMWRLDTFV